MKKAFLVLLLLICLTPSIPAVEETTNPASLNQTNRGLADAFRTYFVKTGKYAVLDRTKMTDIVKEQKFQLTGANTKEYAVELGKILNVNYMAMPNISRMGQGYLLNLRITNVESSEIVYSEVVRAGDDNQLLEKIEGLVNNATEKMIAIQDKKEQRKIAIMDMDKIDEPTTVVLPLNSAPEAKPNMKVSVNNYNTPSETQKRSITVYITKTGSKYHRLGCRFLSHSCIAISLEDAQARYSPCSVCV